MNLFGEQIKSNQKHTFYRFHISKNNITTINNLFHLSQTVVCITELRALRSKVLYHILNVSKFKYYIGTIKFVTSNISR